MYIYIYIHIYTYVHVYIYRYICMYIYKYIIHYVTMCVYIYIYTYIHDTLLVCVYVYIYIYIYIHAHTYTYRHQQLFESARSVRSPGTTSSTDVFFYAQSPYSNCGFQRVWLHRYVVFPEWNSHVQRGFPGKFESSNVSREIGRTHGRSVQTLDWNLGNLTGGRPCKSANDFVSSLWSAPVWIKIHQRGVQWKQGVVVHIIL